MINKIIEFGFNWSVYFDENPFMCFALLIFILVFLRIIEIAIIFTKSIVLKYYKMSHNKG